MMCIMWQYYPNANALYVRYEGMLCESLQFEVGTMIKRKGNLRLTGARHLGTDFSDLARIIAWNSLPLFQK